MELIEHLQRGETRGRGAVSNEVGRFEPYMRVQVDGGWPPDKGKAALRTQVAPLFEEWACLGLADRSPFLRKDLFEVPLARGAQLSLF